MEGGREGGSPDTTGVSSPLKGQAAACFEGDGAGSRDKSSN
jgi:hypothetical protein